MSSHQHIILSFDVRLGNWRVDDQSLPENREWALMVWDRNSEEWIDVSNCTRPGEHVTIQGVHVLSGDYEQECQHTTIEISEPTMIVEEG